jgi:putative FmdB family regulatory protein
MLASRPGAISRVRLPQRFVEVRAMPTYQYRCEECEKTFERTETMAEHDVAEPQCPKCGSRKVSVVPSRVYVVTSRKS